MRRDRREGGRPRRQAKRSSVSDLARAHLERHGPLEVTVYHNPPAWQTFDDATYTGAPYPTYAWGCDVVEVDVDPDTYEVRPRHAVAVCDVGKAIHPTLCKGQIEGGTLQAIGYATIEEIKVSDGRYINDRLATYIIPTIKDSPLIEVELVERAFEGGPFGAKGIGELPMDGAAPAVVGSHRERHRHRRRRDPGHARTNSRGSREEQRRVNLLSLHRQRESSAG